MINGTVHIGRGLILFKKFSMLKVDVTDVYSTVSIWPLNPNLQTAYTRKLDISVYFSQEDNYR